MGLHKLTAGDGYTYLTRQVAAHDATEKGHRNLGDYYDEQGESPGQWHGSGLAGLGLVHGQHVTAEQMKSLFGEGRHPDAPAREAEAAASGADAATAAAAGRLGRAFPVYAAASAFNTHVAHAFSDHNRQQGEPWNTALPAETRARLRTQVGTQLFTHEHDRAPQDARELSGYIARASRQATTAVAGYDLTFSPVKSVSTLWALAPPPAAAQVRAAHDAAVADTVSWLEREAAFTRLGHGGARQVTTRGLIAAVFTHRDSRAGDPDLHTHVALSNKVQAAQDPDDPDGHGGWLALDGRLLYQANVAASERYNTRLEAELTARLGARFADSPTAAGDTRRPVRELIGINRLLTAWWSRRRRDIDARRAQLATDFQDRHGRPPTAVEAIALAQQATLETRAAKHAPRSERDQRASWRHEAARVLGGVAELDAMLDRVLRSDRPRPPGSDWATRAGAAILEAMESRRGTWQVWHLRAEAERQARSAGLPLADLDARVGAAVAEAVRLSVRLGVPDPVVEPEPLRRPDGSSVYEIHGSIRYTSQRILTAARRRGGPALTDVRVATAVAASAAAGVTLNDAQVAMVRELATSGAEVQLALAPAGTGKTTAMRTLASAWSRAGGTVIGLAPSAQAAHQLSAAIDPVDATGNNHTDTLAKLTWTLANAPSGQWPAWIRDVGDRTMVILDEAGQAATTDLAAVTSFITARGGVVRLIGDDQQLAAVAAGGVLRDLQRTFSAVTLSEVRRFDDHAEAAASLAVRDGDVTALGFYADNARIHVGDLGAVTDQAYAAWATDRAAGRDSVLLAPTRDLVSQLNARARADRLSASRPVPAPREVRLVDGNHASPGDAIVSKRNDRTLTLSATDWVKNGDRWTLSAVHPDGSITAQHHALGWHLRLPAAYVADHVQLGYATTVHAAQGMTTDTTHAVVTGDEARQLLYVALSRGRQANHVYLASGHDGDPHSVIRPEAVQPPTALDVLTQILERDGSQKSATTTHHEAAAPATQLHTAVLRYRDALHYAAERSVGAEALATYDAQLDAIWPGLTNAPAYPALRSRLALTALEGHDPIAQLLDAAQPSDQDTPLDRAAVLGWRLEQAPRSGDEGGPLPWLEPIPRRLRTDGDWGDYLAIRAQRATDLAEAVREEARTWSPTATPRWASTLTASEDTELRAELAVWRAAFAVSEIKTRPSGEKQHGTAAAAHQASLDRRVRAAHQVSQSIDRDRVTDALPDPVRHGPRSGALLTRLSRLSRAGVPVVDLLQQVQNGMKPLPDECAADALWWRIVRHLGPAALHATHSPDAPLRPEWVPALIQGLGTDAAQRVMADPAWPALVAAIGARPRDWTAEDLVTAITRTRGPGLPAEDLCAALVWRAAVMTDPPTEPEDHERRRTEPPDAQPFDETSEPGRGASKTTAVDRILQLNRLALTHYVELYPRSWAPAYLRERLGTDLSQDSRFKVGYAPPGPAHLLRYLSAHGATEGELIDAGLVYRRDDGQVTDAFRDRLVFPIWADDDLVGFIARRNPSKDSSIYGGPKYLNTRSTAAFTKSEVLYGLHEGSPDAPTKVTPVIVEGPLDAIAVTISAPRFLGVAPLGTAFTEHQASALRPFFSNDHSNVVVATDGDSAGWLSAQKAFWRLAALGADPQHLPLGQGLDPAALLAESGKALQMRLERDQQGLGAALLAALVSGTELPDAASRLWLSRDAARIIGALPPTRWPAMVTETSAAAELPPGILELDVLDAAESWDDDPARESRHQLREIALQHRDGISEAPSPAGRSASITQRDPQLDAMRLTKPRPTPSQASPAAPDRGSRASRRR